MDYLLATAGPAQGGLKTVLDILPAPFLSLCALLDPRPVRRDLGCDGLVLLLGAFECGLGGCEDRKSVV